MIRGPLSERDRLRLRWPLYEHVIFDFDSTLTGIEGIDVLAERAGVGDQVAALTRRAMDGSIDLESVYERRLAAIHPTQGDIRALRGEYRKHLTEDAPDVIAVLQHLKHRVYIVSGGLLEPIIEIGVALGVPRAHIHAVDVEYDEFSGEWWRAQTEEFSQLDKPLLKPGETELDKTSGKGAVIRGMLAGKRGRSLLVGDGNSDLAAAPAVDLFMGYTGVAARERVLTASPMILTSTSLAPVIAVAAGFNLEQRLHDPGHLALCAKSYRLIDQGAIRFNDAGVERAFWEAHRRGRNGASAIF